MRLGLLVYEEEENEEIQRHNLYFRVNNYIAERINKFYRVPDADTPPEFCKFVTASDVMDRICTNPAFRQSMSNKDISKYMEVLGFKKIHRKTGNGWKVMEMRPDEIENNQKMDGSEDIPPEDLHFRKFCFGDILSGDISVSSEGFSYIRRDFFIQVSQVRELTEVKEVITPYGRSGSEETIVILRKTWAFLP